MKKVLYGNLLGLLFCVISFFPVQAESMSLLGVESEVNKKPDRKIILLDEHPLEYTYVTSVYSEKPKGKTGVYAERTRKIEVGKNTYLAEEENGWRINGQFWSEEHTGSYKFSYGNTTGFQFVIPDRDYEVLVTYYNPTEKSYCVEAWDLRGNQTIYIESISLVTLQEKEDTGKPTIHIAGDSIADTVYNVYPREGWGQEFYKHFDNGKLLYAKEQNADNNLHSYTEYSMPSVIIKNWAQSGNSTLSFWKSGKFDHILVDIRPNDYVMIGFGHNDANKLKPGVYTSLKNYRENLNIFIKACKKKGAKCIILSPTPKCKYKGKQIKTHIPEYKREAKLIAARTESVFLDIGKIIEEFMNTVGEEKALTYYMVLPDNQYMSYPYGRNDRTHYNRKGAKLVSHMLAVSIKENKQISKKIRRAITAPVDYYKGTTVNISKTTVVESGIKGNRKKLIGFQLKWKKINHAEKYIIYQYDSSTGRYKKLVSTKATAYTFSRKWTKQQVKKMKVKAVLSR